MFVVNKSAKIFIIENWIGDRKICFSFENQIFGSIQFRCSLYFEMKTGIFFSRGNLTKRMKVRICREFSRRKNKFVKEFWRRFFSASENVEKIKLNRSFWLIVDLEKFFNEFKDRKSLYRKSLLVERSNELISRKSRCFEWRFCICRLIWKKKTKQTTSKKAFRSTFVNLIVIINEDLRRQILWFRWSNFLRFSSVLGMTKAIWFTFYRWKVT